jgi:hypothetical protein
MIKYYLARIALSTITVDAERKAKDEHKIYPIAQKT